MTSTSPSAFALSATLHAVVIALALLLGYATSQRDREAPKILELVAGVGDNYMATEAPKLGSEGGVKLDIPKTPEPKPTPPEPVAHEPEPVVTPAPQPPKTQPQQQPKQVTPVPKAQDTIPDFKNQMKQTVRKANNKAKKEIAKELAAEKKRQEEEARKLSKEEFDRLHKQKSVASVSPKNTTPKTIDTDGIKEGVVKGTGKAPGAGGTKLTSDNADVLAAYDSLFKQRLREKFESPPGLSDTLRLTFQVRSNADGSLTAPRIIKGSGVREFDQAVLDALRRVRMPERPDKKSETIELNFGMRDLNEG